MSNNSTKLPSPKEIDAMAVLHSPDQECAHLCHDLLNALEELEGATGIIRNRLHVRISAIRARMLQLKCPPCLPE